MRIILCDDDQSFLARFSVQLQEEFSRINTSVEIVTVRSGVDALREISRKPTTMLFLDIDMPEMDGFSVAEEVSQIHDCPIIIFLSSMEHLVFQSFAFHPFWFLRKSRLDELPNIAKKVSDAITAKQCNYLINVNGNTIKLCLSDIYFFEADGHYVNVHIKDQMIRHKASLGEIERELLNKAFVRCHIGFLVNCSCIEIVDKANLLLTNGESIPVSRNNSEKTQAAFMSYMRSLRL